MEEFVNDLKLMSIANDIKNLISNLKTENGNLLSQIENEQKAKNELHNQLYAAKDELDEIKSKVSIFYNSCFLWVLVNNLLIRIE